MPPPATWDMTPRQSIERECRRRGAEALVTTGRSLLRGSGAEPDLLLVVAGPAARPFLAGQPREDDYWLRVWGARTLLWVWHPSATPEIRQGLDDESWRVREMCLKVVGRHGLHDLLPDAARLRDDPVARVRTQAERSVATLVAGSP